MSGDQTFTKYQKRAVSCILAGDLIVTKVRITKTKRRRAPLGAVVMSWLIAESYPVLRLKLPESDAMKRKKRLGSEDDEIEKQELEILKAVAQAWYNHSGSCRLMSEFDAPRRNFKGKPSRFKLQALSSKASSTREGEDTSPATWDFSHSLWDSYELVTVSRRLETGLDSDDPFANLTQFPKITRRKQESKNSLRNLWNKMSSRRFNETAVPKGNDL